MKKEYLILAVTIIVLSAYLYFQKSDSTHYTLPVLEDLKDTEINKIEILKSGEPVLLVKEDDTWVVGNEKYPADKNQVTSLLDTIKAIKLTALVSESENYARYDLDDSKKISITAWDKDKIARKFDIGKTASSYKHTFVKLDNDARVYHAEDNFRNKFDQTEQKLTDKQVMKFDPASVIGVNVTTGKKTIAFERKQEEIKVDVSADDKKEEKAEPAPKPKDFWVAADGKEKDKTKVTAFITTFSNLKCDSFISGAKKEDYTDPVTKIDLNADKAYTLSIFKQEDDKGKYPVVSSESRFPFYLSKETVESMTTSLEEI